MKKNSHKITRIMSSIIILFFIWQIRPVSANSIITPQPIFNTQLTPTQKQNQPNNKNTQKSQDKKPRKKKKTTKQNKKTPSKKSTNKNKTTKSKTVNQDRNIERKIVNSNSKNHSPKNWERYITPPIIIIALILISIFRQY